MEQYKIYYKGKDAHYPEFDTQEEALEFYIKNVSRETGKSREEILEEEWTSPRGLEKCVIVKEV